MTIAYLKRSLKAITVAMDASAQLVAEKSITPRAAFRAQSTDLPGPRWNHHCSWVNSAANG